VNELTKDDEMSDSEQSKARRESSRGGRVFVARDIRREPIDVNLLATALVMIAEDLAAEREHERANCVTESEQPRRMQK
jgi:hypothetical protein